MMSTNALPLDRVLFVIVVLFFSLVLLLLSFNLLFILVAVVVAIEVHASRRVTFV